MLADVTNHSDAALVLVGHGSTVNADSSGSLRLLARRFRCGSGFAEVRVGFWKEEPGLACVLEGLSQPRVFVVPFFVSEGYFSEEAVPQELGFLRGDQAGFPRVQVRDGRTLFYCRPVGTHPRMTQVILSHARSVVEQHPFPRKPAGRESSLFLAGHGTGRNSRSRQSVERQVELIRQKEVYADVQAVFLEEEPRIGDCYRLARTRHVVMVPFFLSDGLHVDEDIPVLLGEPEARVRQRLQSGKPTWQNPTERHGKRVWYAPAVGTDPAMADVVLERVKEAASWADAMGPLDAGGASGH